MARANRRLEEEVARRTAELEQLMRTDPLTGIGNRRQLIERLAEAIRRAAAHDTPLSAIFFDLDHFKRINDLHGHPIGDRVLVRVAGCLRANLRDDDILCRYGGEEFVTVLEKTSLTDAMHVAERSRAAISRIRLREVDDMVSASAGIATWRPGESADAFLSRADKALYRAKDAGRNRCVMDMAA
jgi:diguanylate cyclase (GGDEF)-like protein